MNQPSKSNPYASPLSNVHVPMARNNFDQLDTKALKKLRNHSHTIRALGSVNLLALLVYTGLLLASRPGFIHLFYLAIWITGLVLSAASIHAFWWRPKGGRIIGLISCVHMLLAFPIGTIIGILGIIALVQSRTLFGADKLSHRELDAEWKYRKKNRIV